MQTMAGEESPSLVSVIVFIIVWFSSKQNPFPNVIILYLTNLEQA